MKALCSLVFAAIAVSSGANAQPFKCRDAQGRISYSDVACAAGSQPGKVDTTNSATIEDPARARQLREQDNATLRRTEQERSRQDARLQAESDRLRAANQGA